MGYSTSRFDIPHSDWSGVFVRSLLPPRLSEQQVQGRGEQHGVFAVGAFRHHEGCQQVREVCRASHAEVESAGTFASLHILNWLFDGVRASDGVGVPNSGGPAINACAVVHRICIIRVPILIANQVCSLFALWGGGLLFGSQFLDEVMLLYEHTRFMLYAFCEWTYFRMSGSLILQRCYQHTFYFMVHAERSICHPKIDESEENSGEHRLIRLGTERSRHGCVEPSGAPTKSCVGYVLRCGRCSV